MATISNTISDGDKLTQGKAIKTIAFASESWSRAQQEDSRLRADAVRTVQMDGNWKAFRRIDETEFVRMDKAIEPTPQVPQTYDRRVLVTDSYHRALQIDPNDLVDSQGNVLEDAAMQARKAMGRLCDTVILESIHGRVLTLDDTVRTAQDRGGSTFDTDASGANSLLSFASQVQVKYQDNLFHFGTPKAARGELVSAVGLEDVLNVFRERDVLDDIVCGLTPRLSKILRKDSEFRASERIFRPSEMVQKSAKGWEYADIRFIRISKAVLPKLSESNVLPKATVASGGARELRVYARALSGTDLEAKESTTAGTVRVAANSDHSAQKIVGGTALGSATGYDELELADAQDIAYFWAPAAILFASRDSLMFSREDERRDYSYAKQQYMRFNIGALNIDPDYCLAAVIAGKTV